MSKNGTCFADGQADCGIDLLITNVSQLLTVPPNLEPAERTAQPKKELGLIENAYLAVKEGRVHGFGCQENLNPEMKERAGIVVDATGKVASPGLVEPHTHLVFSGWRPEEFAARLGGEMYGDILQEGGGILSTVRSTRGAERHELLREGLRRLDRYLSLGYTTVEVKSGYGLDVEHEVRLLEIINRLDEEHVVDLVPTFLGAHAFPPPFQDRPQDYVRLVIDEMIPEVASRGLAEFADVFCEPEVFTVEQSQQILSAAAEKGMKLKLHADELADGGGAALAAEMEAVSADHLLMASQKNLQLMARAGVQPVLLPGTAFFMEIPTEQCRRQVRRLKSAGLKPALGGDFNPGTCPSGAPGTIAALACLKYGLEPDFVWRGLTQKAAEALDRGSSLGTIEVGLSADLVLWNFDSFLQLPYHFAENRVWRVIKDGLVFAPEDVTTI